MATSIDSRSTRKDKPARSSASGSPRPVAPDPLAPPASPGPQIDRDPLAKGTVRPNPSGDPDE
jgi:hypothetical protein